MAVVARIEVLTAQLPFRFSFGHALAARTSSTNVYVKLTLDDGTTGYGEGVPREYVTGETVEGAVEALGERYAPALLERELTGPDAVPIVFDDAVESVPARTDGVYDGAARCALELALLDACGKLYRRSVRTWLGPVKTPVVQYDAIIPFSGPRKLAVIAVLVRLAGLNQVKIKVGGDLDGDLRSLRMLRRVLGWKTDLRVDANCAWTADQALRAIERMREYRISAVEQPIPVGDLEGLRRITAATSELIVVDESLRSLEEAMALAEARACDAFNIRVSKCGGLLASMRIARVAQAAGLTCIVGAQVGESGFPPAPARPPAACIAPRYVEGSAGRLLLKEDLTVENVLPGWKGRSRPYDGHGLGVRIKEDVLRRHGESRRVLQATEARAAVGGHA